MDYKIKIINHEAELVDWADTFPEAARIMAEHCRAEGALTDDLTVIIAKVALAGRYDLGLYGLLEEVSRDTQFELKIV